MGRVKGAMLHQVLEVEVDEWRRVTGVGAGRWLTFLRRVAPAALVPVGGARGWEMQFAIKRNAI
jgi:hypothetical protein